MSFWQYVFSFLYVRNWYTGQRELSRPRTMVFIGFLILLAGAIIAIAILHTPQEIYLP